MVEKAKRQAEMLRETADLLDKESMAYFPSENFHTVADLLEELAQHLEAAQPKWISVEERLPEESETVLVYRDGRCGVSRLLDAEPVIMWTYTWIGGDPTHWMPLPEPPKEDV